MATNDYEVFSGDFDSDLEEDLPATTFAASKQDLDSKLGRYLSRSVDQVIQSDEFYVEDCYHIYAALRSPTG